MRQALAAVLSLLLAACGQDAWESPPPRPPKPVPPPSAAEAAEADAKAAVLALIASEAKGDAYAHCVAAEDLPGNRWLPGAAKARCELLAPPPYTLAALAEKLESETGRADVDATFRGLLEAVRNDAAQDTALHGAFRIFDESAEAERVAARWHALAPDSLFARAALGRQRAAAAVAARGTASARETPEANFGRMRALAAEAQPFLRDAMAAESSLTPACTEAIRLARHLGDDALMADALAACAGTGSSSFWFVREMAWTADPRWGGSPEALVQVADYARQRQGINPILGALVGEPARTLATYATDWPPIEPGPASAAWWLEAAREVPDPIVLGRAADQLLGEETRWQRLRLVSQAIRFAPEDDNYRVMRGVELGNAGHFDEGERDLAKALTLAPLRFEVVTFWNDLQARRGSAPGQHRMADETAWYRARIDCHAAIHRGDAAADGCTAALVESAPDEPYGWYLRALALQGRDRVAERAALGKYLALATPGQPSHDVLIARATARLGD